MKADDNDVRNRIITAATECFAENGFKATSVRKICERAGANLAMVNYYFGSKDGLYLAIIDREGGSAEMDELTVPARDASVPATLRLAHLIERLLVDMMTSGPHSLISRLISWELVEPTAALRHIVDTLIEPLQEVMQELVRDIAPPGTSEVEIRNNLFSILGQMLYYSHSKPVNEMMAPDIVYDEAGIREIARHVTAFSLRALGVADGDQGTR
ncbi:CerR family C-terminal domain-containing protein [Massilia pseudoviolaceinigra]|uniref:CerR family C-terminal domain-containing protein n=1 Tax=Massilia pseudoviolaceinigra TaxID=3057165 RepID=UPI0027964F77|nr:CerR family C-terminal domain-containing protein [Massilia sp. CCM 9206]MDQ1923047.1 CerR family C-terminal domain-containing protein [Massilia sp. CCM 9206]